VTYIHELKAWPNFIWDDRSISQLLADIRHRQGRLIGRMEGLGFDLRAQAVLQNLTEDVLNSSEIEGEHLDRLQVRSSIARRLGIDIGGLTRAERHVEGVVEMMLDATQEYNKPITVRRLHGWHAALFPGGTSVMSKIRVGKWRDDRKGPMQVISGPIGKEKVHFQAPSASRVKDEIADFLVWFESPDSKTKGIDPVLKAAIAHFWFVTIHPFEDGNGRIARAITDLTLARSEGNPQRFYSMSAQICSERKLYYEILEDSQKGNLDITPWLGWFLKCLGRAFTGAENTLASVLRKARFWEVYGKLSLNERQRKIINKLLDDFEGKLTSSKWASLGKCSQDTASRDINELIKLGILIRSEERGRSTNYQLTEI